MPQLNKAPSRQNRENWSQQSEGRIVWCLSWQPLTVDTTKRRWYDCKMKFVFIQLPRGLLCWQQALFNDGRQVLFPQFYQLYSLILTQPSFELGWGSFRPIRCDKTIHWNWNCHNWIISKLIANANNVNWYHHIDIWSWQHRMGHFASHCIFHIESATWRWVMACLTPMTQQDIQRGLSQAVG